MAPKVIVYGYDISPRTQKLLQYLTATDIPYQYVEVSPLPPRPELRDLGIVYRRIPVMAIDQDFYCDTALQLPVLQARFPDKALPTSPADEAYTAWMNAVSQRAFALLPLQAFPKPLVEDRQRVWPIFRRPDFASYRPSAMAEFQAALDTLEHDFLPDDHDFISGDRFSMADAHIGFSIQRTIAQLPAEARAEYPKVNRWIERLPKPAPQKIGAEDAAAHIRSAGFAVTDLPFDENDPLQLERGTRVKVEQTDDASGSEPQEGAIESLSRTEVVLGLPGGARLHYPRIGHVVRKL